jgi:hypothetical protein
MLHLSTVDDETYLLLKKLFTIDFIKKKLCFSWRNFRNKRFLSLRQNMGRNKEIYSTKMWLNFIN